MMRKLAFVLSILACAGHRGRGHRHAREERLILPRSIDAPQLHTSSGDLRDTEETNGAISRLLLSLYPGVSATRHVPNRQSATFGLDSKGWNMHNLQKAHARSRLYPGTLLSSRGSPILNTSFPTLRQELQSLSASKRRHTSLQMEENSNNSMLEEQDATTPQRDTVLDEWDELYQNTSGLRACAGAAFGQLLVGFNTGVIAGALLFIVPEFGLESRPQITGLIASSTTIGALFGTLASSKLSDSLGRRIPLLLSSLVFMLCGVLMGLAPTARVLILARLLSGIAAGVVTAVVPTYIAECAETSERGKLAALPQLAVSSGILLSYVVALLSLISGASWRLMLAVSIVPAALQALIVYFLPESPRWLLSKRKDSERALASLRKLRGKEEVSEELQRIVAGLSREGGTGKGAAKRVGLLGLLRNSRTRQTLFLCLSLQFFQQFCGVNAIVYFTPQILKQAGVPSLFLKYGLSADAAALLATLCAYLPKIPSAMLGGYLIDRLGRRSMLKVFIPPLGACLAALGWTLSTSSTTFSAIVATIAVTFFGICFSMSLGPMPTLLTSELFPTSTRSTGVHSSVHSSIKVLFS